jgi:hypothetical protein
MIAGQIGEHRDVDAGAVEASFGNADRTGFERAGLGTGVGKAARARISVVASGVVKPVSTS